MILLLSSNELSNNLFISVNDFKDVQIIKNLVFSMKNSIYFVISLINKVSYFNYKEMK